MCRIRDFVVLKSSVIRLKHVFLLVPFLAGLLFWFCLPGELFETPYCTVILDRNGELLGASIAEDGQWRFPPREELPEKFVRAVTLYEDRHFFRHPGVDLLAVGRAAVDNFRSRKIASGASTLTMQVIRLSRNRRARTVPEKIREMILALRLELSSSKDEILALYAAHAPFGGNVVGLEAASWRYFSRSPEQLTWAESAMLAVLPNSPSLVFPGKKENQLLAKRNRLLDKLRRYGVIDGLTCSLAKAEPLPSAPHPLPMLAPHLLYRIRQDRQAPRKEAGGVSGSPGAERARFRTSLDGALQNRVNEIVLRHHGRLAANGIHNAAALVLDVDTGQALAYVGNIPDLRDRTHGNHVDVITAQRSTGSILKPLLYAAMLDSGEMLPRELVPDIPTRIGSFMPQNFTRTYRGAVAAREALARSMNVPAVRMLQAYGVDRFYDLLKSMGMTSLHRPASGYGLTLILGGAEGTLWDITGIYAGLARTVNLFFQDETERASPYGRPRYLLSAGEAAARPAVPMPGPGAAWATLEAMLEVSRPDEEGAWRNFTSSQRIAWKTGTSYGLRDGWAVGVTPRYAVGVWAGNADGEGRSGLTGIATAAPVLFEIFGLLDYSGWFEMPEADMAEVDVCAHSGHLAGPYCNETARMHVPLAGLKARSCPYCRPVQCDASLQWRVHGSCERIGSMRRVNRFVLPPAWEWFYRRNHSDYQPLPPYRSDCMESFPEGGSASLSLIYPRGNGEIYVPVELDGTRGRTVFEAAHRNPDLRIYWHLDEEFLGTTRDIHQIALDPEPGPHTLTLVDENGERLVETFRVLAVENKN
ncbi:MAG: penicillin-binding protein 1C [Acidobacteria bacterium]|nr:penicillin-binding protein 1C [Acidobacteriota bacterium]